MSRLVCVTHVFPWPLDTGGALRVDGLIRALAARYDVHVLALARSDTGPGDVAAARERLGVPVECFDRPAEGGPLPRGWRWLRSVATGVPPWVLAQEAPAIDDRLRELLPDAAAVVFVDDFAGIHGRRLPAGVRVVQDKHMVMTAATRLDGPGLSVRERLAARLGASAAARFERAQARRADVLTVTSPEEQVRFRQRYGRAPDAVVPSAVDLAAAAPPPGGPLRVAWLGVLDHPSNVEGLTRFVHEGWVPCGLAAAGARLVAGGRNPGPGYWALDGVPGVELTGPVADQAAFLAGTNAAVVPLWHGAGVKLKTVTFLGAGLPTVTTTVGAEGLGLVDGVHCVVADEPRAIAGALERLAADPALRERLGRAGRALVAERFTWERVGGGFAAAVSRVAGG